MKFKILHINLKNATACLFYLMITTPWVRTVLPQFLPEYFDLFNSRKKIINSVIKQGNCKL